MKSKNNSGIDESTIDNIISELEQLEKRRGERPVVNVHGEFSREVRLELEQRGYDCSQENASYNLGTNTEDLTKYNPTPTQHFPQFNMQ